MSDIYRQSFDAQMGMVGATRDNWLEPFELPAVFECDLCGGGIYDGDGYFPILDDRYCEHCMDGFKQYAEAGGIEDEQF